MSLFPRIRRLAARSAFVRGVGLWLIAGVLLSAWVRWDVHSHPDANPSHDAMHTHAGDAAHSAEADPAAPPASGEAGVVHMHDLAPGTIALDGPLTRSVSSVPAARWTPPRPDMPARSLAGPPPHRPPIA